MPGKSEPNIFSEMVGVDGGEFPWNKVKKSHKKKKHPKLSKDKVSVAGMSLLLVKKAGKKRSSSTHTKHHKTLEVKDQGKKGPLELLIINPD